MLLATFPSIVRAQDAAASEKKATSASQAGDDDMRRFDLFHILKVVLQPPEDAAVCVVVSREFVNAFFAAPVSEDSSVGATILGTYVTGKANTVANLQWQLQPNADELDLQITLAGQCDSNTMGGSGPVDVHTNTNADFTAVKRVRITPEGIHSHAANVNAYNLKSNPQVNSNRGGLVGRIATNIGRNVVARNHGQLVSESRAHLQQEVGTQVDNRVNDALVKLRQMVVDAKQSEDSIFQRTLQLRTTDKVLMLATGTIPQEVLDQAENAPEHEITLIVSRPLVERFRKDDSEDDTVANDEGVDVDARDDRGRRLRLLARLEPSMQTWSPDHEWLTLRWDVDSERIAWLVKTADKVKNWVEHIDPANPVVAVSQVRTPAEVRTGAEVQTAPAPQPSAPLPQQIDARVRFFPFTVEVETQPPQPLPAAQTQPAPR
jgi:hypothetical protein